ncbi:uncharacterized protein METZ01_LOCUS94444 [marine metagenome]|uniref:DNA-3-methyladenine glycosylase I n=1 Tax=marine metagenome TaxID=408172 RepID=A0A381VMQ2_9ZZZZ|tara:strand:- start:3654 stop:4235 length:582 start_codon:yes stop_codon:yes gene_type:complete
MSNPREGYCSWSNSSKKYQIYHDNEWGLSEYNDKKLWEMFVLEGFQAGLSWITILNKRENFREAFDNFDPKKISNYGLIDIERLLKNKGIVRSRIKINATINNSKLYNQIFSKNGSFSDFLWYFVDGKPIINHVKSLSDIQSQTELSIMISKEFKRLGFKFCGPTIMYAFMQAVGIVNDHITTCPRYFECQKG